MRNKRKASTVITLLTAFEGFILYLAPLCVPKDNVEEYPAPFSWRIFQSVYPWACENMSSVAFYSFLGLTLIFLVSSLFQRKRDKQWLKEFFKHIINQHLGGETYETRITLYVKCLGIRFIVQYIWFAIVQCFRCRFFYLKHIPNPFKHYLRPYVRWSYPENHLSYTYFRAISSENDKPHGVVENCYKSGKIISVNNAPYIKGIDLSRPINMLTYNERKQVKNYMRETKMDENDYEMLRCIQRRANAFLAFPFRKKQKNWGVVVIDNLSEGTPLDIEAKLNRDDIDNYQKIIQLTVNSLGL